MTGEELKKSILQQAIQGKLVPQNPADEPASVLLARIREEKSRLVKEGKIKKSKTESIIFRGEDNSYYEKMLATGEVKCIDDEIPFEIPKGWEWCRIRNISQSYIGLTYSPSEASSQGTIVLRSSNIQDGRIVFDDIVRVTKNISEKLLVEKNDIIICARNGSAKLVGKSAIVTEITEPMTFGAFMAICKTSLYQYVSIFLQSDLFFSQLRGVSGTTTINQLTQNSFNGFLIAIPPLEEQHRIFEKINDVLPIVEIYGNKQKQLNRLNDNLRENVKKSILQEAIQGKLVPQIAEEGTAKELLEQIKTEKQKLVKEGKLKKSALNDSVIFRGDDNKYYETIGKHTRCIDEELPFEIPESWCWARLSSIANLYTGDSINEEAKRKNFTNCCGRNYIGTKDVGFDHVINYDNGVKIPASFESEFRIAPSGSVLMCIEGGSAGRKISILSETVCFGNKLCCFAPYGQYSKYIYYYLQSPAFFDIFNQNKSGIIGGVSLNTLKTLLIPVPPLPEIARIEKIIDKALASIMSR